MERRGSLRRWAVVGAALMLPAFTGCTGFFPPVDNSGGSGGGTGAGGNQVYVLNQTTKSVGGFAIGTATLTALNNSPIALQSIPFAEVVTPNNAFLYVAGQASISLYLINSDGSLSVPTAGAFQNALTAASLTVSPDGQWLIALESLTQQLDVYQINASTGALSDVGAVQYSLHAGAGTWQPSAVKISPDGTLIFAALSTAGDVVFSFNTTTGLATQVQSLANVNATTGDYALAIDPKTAYLYIARSGGSGGIGVYTIGAGGVLNSVTGSPFAAGSGTMSVVLDSTGTYVYAGNRTDSTISGYTIVAGATPAALSLKPLSGSPYKSGTSVQSLGIDRTGKYLLAAATGGTPDLTMYSFDITTPGKLDAATSVATDIDPAGAAAVALTH